MNVRQRARPSGRKTGSASTLGMHDALT